MRIRTVLGIESSCDETAAAVVRGAPGTPGTILSNTVFDQTCLHRGFGGVVPEIAARAHAERLDIVVMQSLAEAGLKLADLDAIAVTAGPGLIGGVLAGVMTARGIAAGARLPLIAINHLEGHALSPRLSHAIAYPYLLLLVSGGHCQFLMIEAVGQYRRLGSTIDDAPGEAFDKVAKLLGIGFPGGPVVEARARRGNAARFDLPRPLLNRPGCDLSFSGLKTALAREVERLVTAQGGLYLRDIDDLCASFQAAVADVLAEKAKTAIAKSGARALAVAGGVAANGVLRNALEICADQANIPMLAPPLALCTDNGAMIAWAGIERLAAGRVDGDVRPRPRWPLDENAAPVLGSGKKGAKA